MNGSRGVNPAQRRLYTDDERARRDASVWTTVQGILAPLQFLVFVIFPSQLQG